jgi:hypothetical protein
LAGIKMTASNSTAAPVGLRDATWHRRPKLPIYDASDIIAPLVDPFRGGPKGFEAPT